MRHLTHSLVLLPALIFGLTSLSSRASAPSECRADAQGGALCVGAFALDTDGGAIARIEQLQTSSALLQYGVENSLDGSYSAVAPLKRLVGLTGGIGQVSAGNTYQFSAHGELKVLKTFSNGMIQARPNTVLPDVTQLTTFSMSAGESAILIATANRSQASNSDNSGNSCGDQCDPLYDTGQTAIIGIYCTTFDCTTGADSR